MKPIPFTQYIANNNTAGAQTLLAQWSLPAAKNMTQLVASLNSIISHGREQGYMAVAGLHPDKDMILSLFAAEKSSSADGSEAKHSFCPCLGADGGCGCSSADGEKKSCGGCKKCREKKSGYDGGYMNDWANGGYGTNMVTQDQVESMVSKQVQAAVAGNQSNSAALASHQGNYTLLIGGAVLITLAVVLMRK